jgi:hypothetical protein
VTTQRDRTRVINRSKGLLAGSGMRMALQGDVETELERSGSGTARRCPGPGALVCSGNGRRSSISRSRPGAWRPNGERGYAPVQSGAWSRSASEQHSEAWGSIARGSW